MGPFWVDDYIFEENEDKRAGQNKTHIQPRILSAYDDKSVHVFDFKICPFSTIKKKHTDVSI